MRTLASLILILGLASIGCRPVASPGGAARSEVRSASDEPLALDAMPWTLRVGLERAVAADVPSFLPRAGAAGPTVGAEAQASATVEPDYARLVLDGREATLRLTAIGRGRERSELRGPGAVSIDGPDVRTTRSEGVVEWWRALPSGLEHGVDVRERLAGSGELCLELALGGDLRAVPSSDDAVALVDGAGTPVASYAHLVVLDADGARQPARLATADGHIAIFVDDRDARYPLVVDPLVATYEAMLTASGGAANDSFGRAVALSSDASRALIGVPSDDSRRSGGPTDMGSGRVFRRAGTVWSPEAMLIASDAASGDFLGTSVALSSDGSVAILGASGDDTASGMNTGSARVFVRTGTTWTEGDVLVHPTGAPDDAFGIAVAIAGDGRTVIVGAPNDDTAAGANAGSAHVFSQTGTAPWVHGATLTAAGAAAGDLFGMFVGMSRDGNRALASAPFDGLPALAQVGSVRVFARAGASWTEEAALTPPAPTSFTHFGSAVALSADGTRAVGGLGSGDLLVFVYASGAWAHEALLDVPDLVSSGTARLAISDDGARILAGHAEDASHTGAAWVFRRTGPTWAPDVVLRVPGGSMNDELGFAVALSADGTRALAGAPGDATAAGTRVGSAHVFTLLAADGSPCSLDASCASGFCTDGVCCGSRCGGGAVDCQACTAALTGGLDGTCAPLSATVSATVTCRASAGACDPAETCSSGSTTCPADLLAPATAVCRAATDACDVAETCSGASAACPANTLVPTGTECRPAVSPCDVAEVCDGVGSACPTDAVVASGLACRSSTGPCDPGEVCDGASPICPADGLEPAGTVCGVGIGDCALPAVCTGSSAMCPSAGVRPAGTTCRPASGPCDADDVCDGVSQLCPEMFAPATTTCGAAPSGDCDAPDHCSGTSVDCEPVLAVGTECRASSAACDPREVCDGTSSVCPSDVTMCVDAAPTDGGADDGGTRDASIDAARIGDAARVADAGTPSAAGGCACRVVHHRDGGLAWLAAASIVLALGVRRRARVPRLPTVPAPRR